MSTKIWLKIISITFLGLTAFGMTGCGSVTPFPEATATITATMPVATRTSRPIPTPTPTLLLFPTAKASEITENCITVEKDAEIPYRSDFGALVINSWFYPKWTHSKFEHPYLFTAPEKKTTLETKLSMFELGRFVTSPDQTAIAVFFRSKSEKVHGVLIFNRNQKLTTRLVLPKNLTYGEIIYWLNQGMLFETSKESSNGLTDYVLYDPFNKVQLALQTEFPNRYFPDLHQSRFDKIYYDPTLSRAIYFAQDKMTNTLYYSLWDLDANMEIAQYRLGSYSLGITWTHNGEFAIADVWLGNQSGLVKIYRDGKSETIFAGDVHDFSISPDSKFLAYWLVDEYQTDFYTLFIKNLETGNIQNLCLRTDYHVGMVWSPDSKNLAASFEYEGDVITTVIDFEEKVAYKIDDVAIPVAWLK